MFNNVYLMPNQAVQNRGETVTDNLMTERAATLAGGAATVKVPYAGGSEVYYLVAKKAVAAYNASDDDFEVDVDATTAIGATEEVVVLIFAQSGTQQFTKPD